jgi:hypothetical protein
MALNWLPGRKIDHPMASMKKAREMVDALPRGEFVRALEEVVSWLESINREPGFKLDYRLELLDMIDRAAKPHWHAVSTEYLDAPRLQKQYESRLWTAFFVFWKMLGDSYLRCVKQYQSGQVEPALEKVLPLIVGRALRSLTVQIKWRLLRYEIVEERIWEDVGSTYQFAESRGFARTQAAIYPGAHGQSSAQEELLKALLLAVSSPDALTPPKLQIAERVIAHVARLGSVDTLRTAGCGFYFDLGMHTAPARVHKGMRMGNSVRFFGPGTARRALNEIAQAINEKGGVPDDLNLGSEFDKQSVMSVLSHIGRYWAETPPERRAPRLDLVTRLTVVPGFNAAVAWITSSLEGDSLEFVEPVNSESWVVANASEGGYGATVPTTKGDWLKVGALIGLRAEGQPVSRAGILRRTTRDKDGQRRVGIEVPSKVAIPVRFSHAQGEKPAVPAGDMNNALLLNNKPDANGQVELLLRAGSYLAGKPAHVFVRGKGYVVSPIAAREEGEDFDLTTYKIVRPL